MKVLITGAAGYVGRRVAAGLDGEHELRLADVHPLPGDPRFERADVTSLEDMLRVTAGMDAVVHLAVASGLEGEEEDDAFNVQRFEVNVRGTYNVLEAARRSGVRRVVHTSSVMVTWGYPPGELIPSDAPPRTAGTYSLTKAMAEAACEHFARTAGLSIVCLRIAKPIDPDDPSWRSARLRPQWLPFPDLIQAYRRALVLPEAGFEVVTVVGEGGRARWDLEKAERVLGYRSTVDLRKLGYEIGGEREAY